jgi:hypothetical protein
MATFIAFGDVTVAGEMIAALVLPPIGWLEARGEVLGNDALLMCWDLQEVTLISTSKTLSVKDVSSFCERTEKD